MRALRLILLSATLLAHPALAIEVGVGADVGVGGVTGGVSGNVGADAGPGGTSVGGGAQGEVSVGGSSPEAPTGGAGGQGGSSTGGQGAAPGGTGGAPAAAAETPSGSRNASGTGASPGDPNPLLLPAVLLPFEPGRSGEPSPPVVRPSGPATTGSVRLGPLVARAGTSASVVGACREAIASAAMPLGASRVDVVGAGRSTRMRGGGVSAPVEARIVYARNGKVQVRQAQVACRLNSAGQVVAAL